jgi:hypothetical protein
MSRWTTRRITAVTATTLLVTALGAGAAWASDEPTPKVSTSVNGDQVTITTDLATARAACTRVDAAEARLTALVARIQGDAGTRGSVAFLQARARRAADNGHADLAATLTARATRRGDRVADLQRAIARLHRADLAVCDALPAAGR